MQEQDTEAYLDNVFTYHPPTPEQIPKYEELRAGARALAALVLKHCPASRERSLALTKIEEAAMHANSAVARHT